MAPKTKPRASLKATLANCPAPLAVRNESDAVKGSENVPQNPYEFYCVFEDWHWALPDEYKDRTLQQWLAMSRRGNFCPYFKAVNERSVPMFRRKDVVSWFMMKFQQLHPEAISALRAANFPEPSAPQSGYPQPKKRGARRATP